MIGGGPAGAATALAIAQRGLSVAVLVKPRGDRPRVGETVPPAIVRPLAQLGLWNEFLAAQHAEAPGTMVIWGSERPHENDFIFNPYGPGWHLDRSRFDGMLLEAARAAGAAIHDTSARDCLRDANGTWQVLLSDLGGDVLSARWLVDATGRAAWLGRRLGARRHRMDRLVALIQFAWVANISEPRTMIESCPYGWWYAAALPNNVSVAAFFTDADLLPNGAPERARLWRRMLAQTRLIASIYPDSDVGSPVYTEAAFSGRSLPCAGENWLAVGDASHFYDPLSGQGISKALLSALRGAETINLSSGKSAEEFIGADSREYEQYVAGYLAHYRRELRWPQHPFWMRRNVTEPGRFDSYVKRCAENEVNSRLSHNLPRTDSILSLLK
ncbi:MAG: tryptophan 7-halogenase [Xanthobacteraceae bacterium]